ncbi:MAG: hypothetical protein ACFFBD_22480 [Candidatus Hodarchaeota archaeon]
MKIIIKYKRLFTALFVGIGIFLFLGHFPNTFIDSTVRETSADIRTFENGEMGGIYLSYNVSMPLAEVYINITSERLAPQAVAYSIDLSCNFTVESNITGVVPVAFVYPQRWSWGIAHDDNQTEIDFNIHANETSLEYEIMNYSRIATTLNGNFSEFRSFYGQYGDFSNPIALEARRFAVFNVSLVENSTTIIRLVSDIELVSDKLDFRFSYIVDTVRTWEYNTWETIQMEFHDGTSLISYDFKPDPNKRTAVTNGEIVTWEFESSSLNYSHVSFIAQNYPYLRTSFDPPLLALLFLMVIVVLRRQSSRSRIATKKQKDVDIA